MADAAAATAQSRRFERAVLKTPAVEAGEAIADAVERRRPRLLVAEGARAGAAL